MNNLCLDVGYKSIFHFGEQLCGDHVNVVDTEDGRTVVVLADGLGSGVKASILSTITSQMISTLLSNGITLKDAVESISKTLPVDKQRDIAYSTFTIADFDPSGFLSIVQFDNPEVVMLRDGKVFDFDKDKVVIGDKTIYKSKIELKEGDMFAIFTDGCPYAGLGMDYNFGFGIKEIKDFLEILNAGGANARTVSAEFIDHINKLYGFAPGDDATCVIIKVKKRTQVNVVFGPPSNREDCSRMMSLFFSKVGKHVVCGGTTAKIAADYLGKELEADLNFIDSDVPPMGKIEGVDLVTEGIITMNKVKENAEDFLKDNILYQVWGYKKDAASILSRLLFEEATDIDFYVGRAINPAHQNPDLPINFSIKMNIVEELMGYLKQMGKNVKGNYF